MSETDELSKWWRALVGGAGDRETGIEDAYQAMENAGLISKVTVHRYICKRGCGVLGTAIRVDGRTILRTTDYKFSPGMNAAQSAESARQKNTLDGNRHWPGHTFEIEWFAELGTSAGMDMNCRHTRRTILASDVLTKVTGVTPGHPGKPTLL